MADKTGIQWSDATWNPVTGCEKVSPGCAHCYAESVALRFWAKTQPPTIIPTVEGETTRPRIFTDVRCHDDRLSQPLRWTKPRKIFVNSMSDLFHDSVADEFIDQVFAVMAMAPQHTFQVLTKRADRMQKYLTDKRTQPAVVTSMNCPEWIPTGRGFLRLPRGWPLQNVWLGVSVENQYWADKRIPLLLETPAAIRFVSYEPALGPIDFRDWLKIFRNDHVVDESGASYNSLDWVIIGGESGKSARPFNVEWLAQTIAACREAGVACFAKQLGANPVVTEGSALAKLVQAQTRRVCDCGEIGLRDSHGGDQDEWPPQWRLREFPTR